MTVIIHARKGTLREEDYLRTIKTEVVMIMEEWNEGDSCLFGDYGYISTYQRESSDWSLHTRIQYTLYVIKLS